ncbi:MAG: 1-phosphofructokinase [Rubrobacter sp.]|nr:1-phosphofructokinase [Rubrobacter sp.]
MIPTVTPNPSLDLTYRVGSLEHGAVQRAEEVSVEAGGKGVNVSRNLVRNGVASRAIVPVGWAEGERFLSLLSGFEVIRVPISEDVRMNLSLVEPGGVVTKINAPGPRLSAAEIEILVEETANAAKDTEWLAVCGSLPAGTSPGLYATLVEVAREAGCRVAADTSGESLRSSIEAEPDLIKPNHEELAELVGRKLKTFGDILESAKETRAAGVGSILVSLGPDGAMLIEEAGTYHAETPPFVVKSTVGAGDSLLSGFLAAGGSGEAALVEAVAWGAAAAKLPGTTGPAPEEIKRGEVKVSEAIDMRRPLADA